LAKADFPILRESLREEMISEIENTRSTGDSLGGMIECSVIGLSAGVGDPFFESMESVLSSILFSIPSIKGVEFGVGFDISKMLGSEANDEIFIEDETVKTKTNYNGGINGGISNGMPIVFRVAVKPTPSISKSQSTIDFLKKENVELSINGRHDVVIVPRVLPVVEAVTAIAILDMIL
ncbi:chorismate synthase, partial [Peptostreptococcus porci]|uniref:chorismate synthase n=1 Tax=Peptostreptococcus porci TaxID=2652282 RepID=UPI002A919E7C